MITIRTWWLAAFLSLLSCPSWAFVNGTTFPLSLTADFGAKADAVWGVTGCQTQTVSGHVGILCPGPGFVSTDVGKAIILDDGGGSGSARWPFVTTISSLHASGGFNYAVLSSNPTYSTILTHVNSFGVAAAGSNYSFSTSTTASVQTMQCASMACTSGTVAAAAGTPVLMKVVGTGSIIAGGTGGTPDSGSGGSGNCTVTAGDQSALLGQPTQLLVTLTSGVITSVVSVSRAGMIGADSATYSGGYYAEPVTGCGALSGASVQISYGVVVEQFTPGSGLYNSANPITCSGTAALSTGSSDSGTGLTLNCSTSSSTVSYGTDNTSAFQNALGDASGPASGTMNYGAEYGAPTCIYIPSGNYLTNIIFNTSTSAPNDYYAKGYGCWLGDEHYNTNIFVIPNVQGDVFAWVNANKNGAQPPFANTQNFTNPSTFFGGNLAGSSLRNITIIGNRASTEPQNGIMYYGVTDFAYVENCVVSYMPGRGFGGGMLTSTMTTSYFNESRVNNCHFDNDGATTVSGTTTTLTPSFEIYTAGASDASNDDDMNQIRIFDSWGPGMWIHRDSNSNGIDTRFIHIDNSIFEGSGMSAELAYGDLLEFGDATNYGADWNVANVYCNNLTLINPVLRYAALHVGSVPSSAGSTGFVQCSANVTSTPSSYGRGLQMESCGICEFKMANNNTVDYGLVVGTLNYSTNICGGSDGSTVVYDGNGAESALTSCLDTAAGVSIQTPVRQFLGANSTDGTPPLLTPSNASTPSSPLTDLVSPLGSTSGVTFRVASSVNFQISIAAPLWTAVRTGPTAAHGDSPSFNDTWDSAANFLSALGGSPAVAVGQLFHARVCNETPVIENMVVPTGAGVTGTASVPISSGTCEVFALTITSVSPAGINIVGG
jgi:hypothetical protein